MAHELSDNNLMNACWLAEWMYNRGQCVMEYCSEEDMYTVVVDGKTCVSDIGSLRNKGMSYEDIMVGDLLFFAEKYDSDRVGGSFKGISHVAVVTKAESIYSNNSGRFCYYHEFTEIISNAYARYFGGTVKDYDGITVVENFECDTMQTRPLWENPVPNNYYMSLAWGGSLVMVCRPNLQAASLSNNLKMEAQKMGLHETPKSWTILNAVKRAREYTDTKWTPAVDLKRVSPFSDAVFLHGNEYVGIPQIPSDGEEDEGTFHVIGNGHGIEEFVSSVGVEGTFNTNYKPDGTHASVCSGWMNVTDIVRYAYDVASQLSDSKLFYDFNDGTHDPMNDFDFEIGDVIVFSNDEFDYMAAVVTDVERDANAVGIDGWGESIISVEMCQAWLFGTDDVCNSSEKNGQYGGGLAERKVYPRDELMKLFYDRDYAAYRNFNSGELKYGVNPLGGKPGIKRGNLPLVPYRGNKTYYVGDDSMHPVFRVPLVINDTGYDSIELICYSSNTETEYYTFEISSLDVDENGCVIVEYESSGEEYEPGESYKFIHKCVARLLKTVGESEYRSAPCEWKGIPTVVLNPTGNNFDVSIETQSISQYEANLCIYTWPADYMLSIKAIELNYEGAPVKPQWVFADYVNYYPNLTWYTQAYAYTNNDEGNYLSINVMNLVPVLPASGTLYIRDEEYGVDIDIPMEITWNS